MREWFLVQQNHPKDFATGNIPTAFHNKASPAFDKKWPNLSKSRKLKDVKDMLWTVGFSSIQDHSPLFSPVVGSTKHPQMWRCWMSSMATTLAKNRKTNFQYIQIGNLGGAYHWSIESSIQKATQVGFRIDEVPSTIGLFFEASCCNPAGPAPTTHTCLAKMSVVHTNTKKLSDFVNQDRIDVDVFRISESAKFPLS